MFISSLLSSASTRSFSLENPSNSLFDPRGYSGGVFTSFTGEEVTVSSALTIPAFWAGVNFISDEFASLPWQVFSKKNDERVKSASDPLYYILHDAPNSRTTSFGFRKSMMTNVLTYGRACAYIERNKMGRVMNIWMLDPRCVKVNANPDQTLTYTYRPSTGPVVQYKQEEVIDIVWMYAPDGITEISPVAQLANALGLSIAAERYASKMFQNGGVPSMKMTGPIMAPAAAERASNDVQNALKMARDSGKNIPYVPNGFDLVPIGFDPQKTQMIELRRFQVEEIARILGLPPTSIQDFTRATFSNVEQSDLNISKHLISHWANRWEEEVNLKLFGKQTPNRFCQFNLDGLLRGDFESRMKGYQSAINSAIYTPAEARAKENLPRIQGDDQLFIQSGTMPIAGLPGYSPAIEDVEQSPDPATDPDDGQIVKD